MSIIQPRIVMAIDPGRTRCGMALVTRDERGRMSLLWRKVTATESIDEALLEAAAVRPYSLLIVGSGTTSRVLMDRLRENNPGLSILLVDEKDTTLQARERYWTYNPRRGLRRLLPASLQTPPEPVDDFAALILAERVLSQA